MEVRGRVPKSGAKIAWHRRGRPRPGFGQRLLPPKEFRENAEFEGAGPLHGAMFRARATAPISEPNHRRPVVLTTPALQRSRRSTSCTN